VIFNSGGELITALRGGHVDVLLVSAGTAVGQLADGTVKGAAIAAPQRLGGELADIPTWTELGIDVTSSNWRGIIGPKGLGPDEVKYWEGIMAKVVESPEWKKLVKDNSYDESFMRSAELNKFMTEETTRFRDAFTAIGLVK
jgi:putative tricarboxylic transport membrane protein